MLDIKYIRENADTVKTAIQNKNLNPDVVDEVLRLDELRRKTIVEVQDIRQQRNEVNQKLKKSRNEDLINQSKSLKQKLQELEPELKRIESQFTTAMLQVPNVPADDVPIGKDESDNELIRVWGEKPDFDFEPKDHIELGTSLDLLELDRGSKVSGYRGYYLKNEGAIMQFAIMRFALDKLIAKGFTPVIPPIINRKEAFINSGHFPWGEKEAYALMPEDEDNKNNINELGENYKDAQFEFQSDQYLAGTAEVPLVSLHANEVLFEKDLPYKYAGFSPCYRREIGNYGKDTKGVYRIHEFQKIEQVIICKNDWEESHMWHENLAQYAEEILQELELSYRVLLMCTGDMGEPQHKKYDIETWMPGRNAYGETMSDSIMGEFQSRRANIRYRGIDGELHYAHTLNNTALASPRILVAIWENFQTNSGTIKVPAALRPYMGIDEIKHK